MRCHSQDELVARELEALFIEMAYQRVYYMLYIQCYFWYTYAYLTHNRTNNC
jgi:hypothetical protein